MTEEYSTAQRSENCGPGSTVTGDKAPAGKKAAEIGAMFGSITARYDFHNHLFSSGLDILWRRKLASFVCPGPKNAVLDIAAGTLDVTKAILDRHKAVRVCAGDISEEMLRYGEKKISPAERDRVDIRVMDARSLPFENDSFDAVTMAFGIRNVTPREDALKEALRVLAPGGRFCVLEFAPVDLPVLKTFYRIYLEKFMPAVAGLFGDPEPYRYLAKSIAEFPRPDDFKKEIESAGFPYVSHFPLTFGIANLHVAIKA
ncbi:MAG: ubiquinone/menaquinone biosynthesis methyltransferase [Mailhella sp.]|nr:ubiquinone/menaquinone biosynthesis methyltransferase [Mailhella sp.]